MRSEKFYTLIGIFVIGALILSVIAGMFFYQEHQQAKRQMYVMFFKGSLKGLNSNTPITYRGVKIGEVNRIEVTENKAQNKVMIPVYVQFFVEQTFGLNQNPIHLLISNGYIAQVSKPNFITGVAEIELVKAQARTQSKQLTFHQYPIFPTRHTVEEYINLDDTIKSAQQTFEAIKQLVRSKEIKDLIHSVHGMSNSVDKLALNTEQYLPASLIYFNQAMKKITEAASSTQNLTDYLSRNPESLLRGKQ